MELGDDDTSWDARKEVDTIPIVPTDPDFTPSKEEDDEEEDVEVDIGGREYVNDEDVEVVRDLQA